MRLPNPRSRIFIISVASIIFALLTAITYTALMGIDKPPPFGISFLSICFAAVAGSLAGVLASPAGTGERDTFKSVAGIFAALSAGVLWKTFENELRILGVKLFTGDALFLVHFFSLGIAFVLGGYVAYVYRTYVLKHASEEALNSLQEIRDSLSKLELQLLSNKKEIG